MDEVEHSGARHQVARLDGNNETLSRLGWAGRAPRAEDAKLTAEVQDAVERDVKERSAEE